MKLGDNIYVGLIVAIVLYTLAFRDGDFTASSLAAMGMIAGFIPASRIDRRNREKRNRDAEEIEQTMISEGTEAARSALRRYLGGGDE